MGVRFPLRAPIINLRALSSFGRALPWHGRGDRFEPGRVHQERFLKKVEESFLFIALSSGSQIIYNKQMEACQSGRMGRTRNAV